MAVMWAGFLPYFHSLKVFAEVFLIDLTLAGDNAILIGMAVQNLSSSQRHRAITGGIGFAAFLRIALALIATKLLLFPGVAFFGGLLLLWVSWRMGRDILSAPSSDSIPGAQTFWEAFLKIVIADLSMSLDNVLAVAGAAHKEPVLLIAGLALSVLIMIFAANLVARILERYRWLAWIGLALVLYIASRLLLGGAQELFIYYHA